MGVGVRRLSSAWNRAVFLSLGLLLVTACGTTPEPVIIEVTRLVIQTTEVTVEVTGVPAVEKVTQIVEVEKVVTATPEPTEVGSTTSTITSSGGAAPFDEPAFWDTFPFPEDAQFGAVVEGYDAGFATAMTEPELFDAYADWFRETGWKQEAPIEAISTLPHQVWRNDGAEFLLEIRGLDEAGRTVVWVLVTLEAGVVSPQPASLPSTAAPPMTGGWLATHGGPDGARANRDAHLRLPLGLAWEWGGDGLNRPEAVAIADGRVFLLTSRGELCILDTETGMEQRCQFLWPDEQAIASTTGLVALSEDTIVVSAVETYIEPGQDHASIRSRLATFSWDGEPRWALPPAEDQMGNAHVPRQGLVVSATSDDAGNYWLAAFETASGTEQWRVLGSFALGASGGTNLYTERVAAFRLDTGERLWEHKTDAQYVAYADGYLYAAGDNALTCLQAETGQVLWQTGFGAFLYSVANIGIVVAHDHVYLIPEVGATHHGYRAGVMALDAATAQEQWSALTDEGKSAGFLAASADSVVVIGTDYDTFTEQLWVLDASDGAELDRVTLGDLDVRGLAVAGEQVYVLGPTLLVYGPGR